MCRIYFVIHALKKPGVSIAKLLHSFLAEEAIHRQISSRWKFMSHNRDGSAGLIVYLVCVVFVSIFNYLFKLVLQRLYRLCGGEIGNYGSAVEPKTILNLIKIES